MRIIKDGEVSDLWRALFVETECFDGRWIRRTERWPFGVTVKPGVDPKDIRAQVAAELSWPAFEDPSTGHKAEAFTYDPAEIRLRDPM